MIRIRLLIFILCAVSLSDCRKKQDEHFIPVVRVNKTISTNLAQYNDLNFINGWVYINGGYSGLILYRATQETVKAYDRQAPWNVKDKCKIRVDTGNVTCTDTCSGSQWLLLDGQIVNGPAFYPLKEYQVSFDGTVIQVSN